MLRSYSDNGTSEATLSLNTFALFLIMKLRCLKAGNFLFGNLELPNHNEHEQPQSCFHVSAGGRDGGSQPKIREQGTGKRKMVFRLVPIHQADILCFLCSTQLRAASPGMGRAMKYP
jgi:hypothetical protein